MKFVIFTIMMTSSFLVACQKDPIAPKPEPNYYSIPNPPSGLWIDLSEDSSYVVFHWQDNSDNEDGFRANYWIHYDDGFGHWSNYPYTLVTSENATFSQEVDVSLYKAPYGKPISLWVYLKAFNRGGESDSLMEHITFRHPG